MNLGVYIFTMMRLFTLRSLITVAVLTVVFPFMLGVSSRGSAESATAESLIPTLLNAILPMIIGFTMVADTVANSKNIADGEYLSLLFTRPIRRSSYVVTKWLAGTTGVAMCVYLAYAVFLCGCACVGNPKSIEPPELLNILLNCMSTTALVVLISAVPMRLGMFLFFFLFYMSMVGPLLTGYTSRGEGISSFSAVLDLAFRLIQTVVTPTIDLQEICNSIAFSWSPIVNYVSNTVFYLLFASYLMSKREFFYASE